MHKPLSICGILLYYNNGIYYQQSLDSDVGVIVALEHILELY